jgi:mRNA-degrading endonuclease toxin of MazEF toxin-antitoxin module
LRAGSTILLNQVRTIGKRRLIEKMGTVSAETLTRVGVAIRISLGLVPL